MLTQWRERERGDGGRERERGREEGEGEGEGTATDLRPDLVVWSDTLKVLVLAELTVCLETNFVAASQRKKSKYQDLKETCTTSGYTTHLITLEVGGRGFLNLSGFQKLIKFFNYSRKGSLSLLRTVAREAIL